MRQPWSDPACLGGPELTICSNRCNRVAIATVLSENFRVPPALAPVRILQRRLCSPIHNLVRKRALECAMLTVEEFLAHSIHLEAEAATRFGELADAMESAGNKEVAQLFRQLANYSRLHLADAKARAGFRDIPELQSGDLIWPDLESPECAAIWGADPMIGRDEALEIALAAETAGHDYYKSVRDTTADPEIKRFAAEFAEEEAGHVAELKKWIAAAKAGLSSPAH